MRILASGDGFTFNNRWEEWPEVIERISSATVINVGYIGAGNEYIFNSIIDNLTDDIDYVIVQWALSSRLDLIIDNHEKENIINTDVEYNNNIINNWWLSSASKTQFVQDYHKNYIGKKQALLRTRNYILSLQSILNERKIPYKFFSTYEIEIDKNDKLIDWSKWILCSTAKFSKLYSDKRGNEIQPSTYVHFKYVTEFFKFPFFEQEKINELENLLETNNYFLYRNNNDF